MFVFRRLEKREFDYEFLWGSLGLLMFVSAWAWPYWERIYISACPMKSLFGIPCILCGGTRAMHAWTHAHPIQAWTWNPLAAVIAAGLTVYIPYAIVVVVRRGARRIRLDSGIGRIVSSGNWKWKATLLVGLAANWAYLIWVKR